MNDAEKAYQYFVIAVPENEEQAKAYFWARKALQPTLTPPNEPLTWSELAEMEGQPVYIVEMGARRYWALVMFVSKDRADFATVHNPDVYMDKERYGKSWMAYRRPLEGEGKPTEPPNV